MNTPMILILGVTASGKGQLAFELAQYLDAEIISVDSMKVYKRMDIGTAKPPDQARQKINYHLIDVVEPSESFSVGKFIELADSAIERIQSRNRPVIAVGGTALYIKALLYGLFEGPGSDPKIRDYLKQQADTQGLENLYKQLEVLDPDSAGRIHPNDKKRIIRALEVYKLTGRPISSYQQQWKKQTPRHPWTIIGLHREKSQANHRINMRVKKMIDQELLDEVKSLLAEPQPLSKQARSAIGYTEIIDYLEGKWSFEKAVEKIKINTRRLAKHQRTWFRRFKNVNWLDLTETHSPEQNFSLASEKLKELQIL